MTVFRQHEKEISSYVINEQNTASSRITILPTYWDDTTDIQYMLGKDTVLKSVQMSGGGVVPLLCHA